MSGRSSNEEKAARRGIAWWRGDSRDDKMRGPTMRLAD